ncbi:hypothetical protein Q6264_28335, partial [Klebsiella pneumoniae]|uniref:hypothetical protein n=1 Tax=Klebsiella pneumoniae TaxID=573 RepID=UPI00273111ED
MSRRPSDETWRQVNASATVQAGLLARAQKVAARARDITAAAGGKAKITVDYGIRPGGRARVNVVSDSPEE